MGKAVDTPSGRDRLKLPEKLRVHRLHFEIESRNAIRLASVDELIYHRVPSVCWTKQRAGGAARAFDG